MKKILILLLTAIFVISLLFMGVGCKEKVSGQVEVFSWWTAGGEAEGLQAMIDIFNEKYPDVEFINATVAGGAGFEAKPVLISRLTGGDPPDSFQVHAGHELIDTWGVGDYLEPVNFIFEEEGWYDVYPEDIISILSMGDDILSVPVNIHRSNVLWYNKAVFEDNGIEAPTTFDEFFAAADALEAAGITPLALGDTGIWAAVHLFENVLLGVVGSDDYIGLMDGSVRWDSDEVKEAIQTFVDLLDYVNDDHSALGWDEAAQYVIDGSAACTVMGDWAHGYFMAKGLTPGVEYGYVPSPGTSGIFMALSDTFCLPADAPNRDAAIAWLKICGSKEGQDAFNPIKGSIPSRTDADISLYDVYLKSAINDFAVDTITPSIAHGAAVSETWSVAIGDVITLLVADKDVDATAAAFQAAADENL